MKNQRKIGVLLSYIVIILNMIVGIVYTPFLIRKLGQSEYGLYSIIYNVISTLTIMDMGFGNAIIVYTAKYLNQGNKEKQEKLHGMFFLIYCFIGVVAIIFGMGLYFNTDLLFGRTMDSIELFKAKKMIIILTINLAITFPFSIFGNILIAYERFIANKIIKIVQILLQPICMIPLLILGYKSIAMVLVLTIVNIICLILNTITCYSKLKIKLVFKKIDLLLFKEIFIYSFFIFLNQLVDKINWCFDNFILGAVSGTVATAIYAVAGQLNNMYRNFSTAISGVMLSKIAKMEDDNSDSKTFTEVFIKTGRIQYLLMALIISGFVLFGKQFILFWAGEGYEEAYYIACILMIPITIPLIQNVGLSILQVKNMHKFRTIVFLFIAIINVSISIPLSAKYNGIGAAIGTSMSLIIGQGIILNIYYHRKVGINIIDFWKNIIQISKPMIIVISFGIVLDILINDFNIFVWGAKIVAYALLYIIVVWKYSMNTYEQDLFKKPLKKLFSRS